MNIERNSSAANRQPKQKTRWGILAGIALVIFAIWWVVTPDHKNVEFAEQVEIAPGEIIIIERRNEYISACEGLTCSHWKGEKIKILKGGAITADWTTSSRIPMVLMRSKRGDLVLIAVRGYCDGLPKYLQYVLNGDVWALKTDIDSEFLFRDRNLSFGNTLQSRSEPLTLKEKQEEFSRPGRLPSDLKVIPGGADNC